MEPLGKNHRMYAPWPDVDYFFGPINRPLPPSCFSQFSNTPKLPKCSQSECFECVVSVCVRRLRVSERS
jgi:hypothetical protein